MYKFGDSVSYCYIGLKKKAKYKRNHSISYEFEDSISHCHIELGKRDTG